MPRQKEDLVDFTELKGKMCSLTSGRVGIQCEKSYKCKAGHSVFPVLRVSISPGLLCLLHSSTFFFVN